MSKPKAIIVSGYFNPLHKGHIELFEKVSGTKFERPDFNNQLERIEKNVLDFFK